MRACVCNVMCVVLFGGGVRIRNANSTKENILLGVYV